MVEVFHENIISDYCLDRSGLNDIYHLKGQSFIIKRSLFMALHYATGSWTTDKME